METEPLRQALGDAARVARGIQGLQRDAGGEAEPVSGRLKVRIAGHTITYRGTLRITEDTSAATPSFTVSGEATEVRGSGSVELSLGVSLLATDEGTRLVYSGTGKGDGRVAELEKSAVEAAVRRLLNRFSESLAGAAAPTAEPEPGPSEPMPRGRSVDARKNADADLLDDGDTADEPDEPDEPDAADRAEAPGMAEQAGASETGASETGASETDEEEAVPPSALDPFHQDAGDESFIAPPAEAAHARRTMIGRSAEEVDHAPPRGRYAPVPAPQAATAGDTLRWAAPAAALVVASAIVVGRVLRRRR
ncbi:SRPBCC domain-containing protein [Streptomyces sp. LHD-70]|uniref:SRPBCC domain-containing protein n=1 Tax=Streptomyces sp. LHD-70 TaxID=3072140 RepID=UPI00280F3F55|nr:SRPBCC domain-containing protein [Streptomyces sp. LHD-70]MDQ8706591.1 SRPBCC domain-containing protein [Streptomyces sp. LHD-70]